MTSFVVCSDLTPSSQRIFTFLPLFSGLLQPERPKAALAAFWGFSSKTLALWANFGESVSCPPPFCCDCEKTG